MFVSKLDKFKPLTTFYITLLSFFSPVELGKAFMFEIWSFVIIFPNESNIYIPFRPIKF